MRSRGLLVIVLPILTVAAACGLVPSDGGGQTEPHAAPPNAADVAVPEGYHVDVVTTQLDFPVGVAFDGEGTAYVLEAGYSYGEVFAEPRIKRVRPDGKTEVVARGKNPPWTGLAYHGGRFVVAEGGGEPGGRILSIGLDGSERVLVEGLPSAGDHHTNGPVVGPDGSIYFGQGTATNSGVVGEDNAELGWLHRKRAFHDVPCEDVRLAGHNYETNDPLTPGAEHKVRTGAFVPFGTETKPGQIVEGRVPCSGAILRIPAPAARPVAAGGQAPSAPAVELVAWGFRNPFGLAFAPDGQLYVAENGFDVRGSRPVWGTGDVLWRVEPGRWYGWPDHSAGRPIDQDRFTPPGREKPAKLLDPWPGEVPEPVAIFGVHSSTNGIDFSQNPAFGHVGEAFVAQFGDMAPSVGSTMAPVGFRVLRVDVRTGVITDFASNRGDENGPASKLGTGGLERPVAVRFDPMGTSLYVVDFGVMTVGTDGPEPRLGTGTLWRVRRIVSQ